LSRLGIHWTKTHWEIEPVLKTKKLCIPLNSMQVTMAKTNNRLQELLAPISTTNLDDINKQRMSCEFYKSSFVGYGILNGYLRD